ncbi:MAG TPA: hypothetical protein PK566_10075 [Pseudobacteroides sp.]|nr:hypothetical protein [Pseudobacteroides sp.]
MDGNVELLNYIHQNAEMGEDTIKQLLGIARNDEFKDMLRSQLDEYKLINDMANDKLKELGKSPKDLGAITKARTYMAINLKTMTNKSPSNISQMMIQGSTMGIIDITKKMKEYSDADKEVMDLAQRLLTFEQRNVDECKKYLH